MKRLALLLTLALAALAAGSAWAAPAQPTADDVVKLVTEKLQAKYRAEVDRTCDRLWEKVKLFSPGERDGILSGMRFSVVKKVEQVRGLASIDPIRRQADLDLLEYVVRKLDALAAREG